MKNFVITKKAYGKTNLFLRCLHKREDSFTEIETLFLPVPSVCDTLSFSFDDSGVIRMECDNPSLPCDGGNLCVRAAEKRRRPFWRKARSIFFSADTSTNPAPVSMNGEEERSLREASPDAVHSHGSTMTGKKTAFVWKDFLSNDAPQTDRRQVRAVSGLGKNTAGGSARGGEYGVKRRKQMGTRVRLEINTHPVGRAVIVPLARIRSLTAAGRNAHPAEVPVFRHERSSLPGCGSPHW